LLRADSLALAAIQLAQRTREPRRERGIGLAHLYQQLDHQIDLGSQAGSSITKIAGEIQGSALVGC
jgi:hypothetical protein